MDNLDLKEIVGYHCTTEDNYKSIVKHGFQIKTDKSKLTGDLGTGIYFFIKKGKFDGYDPGNNAIKFCKKFRNQNNNTLVLISATICLDNILDLRGNEEKELINKFREKNINIIEEYFNKLKNIQKRKNSKLSRAMYRGNLDGLLLDQFQNKYKNVKGVIKDTYTAIDFNGYKRSAFPNGVECCVYDLDEIKNIKKVKDIL